MASVDGIWPLGYGSVKKAFCHSTHTTITHTPQLKVETHLHSYHPPHPTPHHAVLAARACAAETETVLDSPRHSLLLAQQCPRRARVARLRSGRDEVGDLIHSHQPRVANPPHLAKRGLRGRGPVRLVAARGEPPPPARPAALPHAGAQSARLGMFHSSR